MTTPTHIPRAAIVQACAATIQALGLTLHELADALGAQPQPERARTPPLPVPRAVPVAPITKLSETAAKVLACCEAPAGGTVAGVSADVGINQQGAQQHLQTPVTRGDLVRIQARGERCYRYFRDQAAANAYRPGAAPAPAPKPEPARVALSDAEARTVRIQVAKVAGAAAVKAKMTPIKRKPEGRPGAELVVKRGPASPAPAPVAAPAEPVTTAATRVTQDTTVRPTARWQMQVLPPDPRFPSFSGMRPGVNPDTGKEWERRA